jgi:hypothetical protein
MALIVLIDAVEHAGFRTEENYACLWDFLAWT